MPKKIVAQLKTLRQQVAEPRAEWLAANRALLLTQVKNSSAPKSEVAARASWEGVWSWMSIFVPRNLVYNFVRPMAVLVVVALVGTSGWVAGVDAAYDALPGDGVAYFLKRGIENTQVAVVSLVGDNNAQAKIHLKLASTRASEVKKMLTQNLPDENKTVHIATAVADLKQEINTVNTKIESSSNAQTVKDVAVDTKQIKNLLQDAKNLLSASTTPELAEQVRDVKDLAKDTSVKAVESLVNKVALGDQSVSTDEVKQVLDKTLQSVATDAKESQATAESLKAAVDSIKKDAALTTSTLVNTTSTIQDAKDFAKKVDEASTQTNVVALQAKQVSSDVTTQVAEAQNAILSGDLAKAVGTIKDVAQVTKTVEQLTDSATQNAQFVLPVVSNLVKEVASGAAVVSTTAAVSSTVTTTR